MIDPTMTMLGEQEVALVGELMEVIVHVQDMNPQVAFYRDTLGLKVSYPTNKEDYSKESWVTLETGRCVLALHGGGRTRLSESPSHRIVFRTQDIQAARNQLLRKGVQAGETRSPAPGVQVFDARDPEGNVFSIESHR